jgi:hypothetical protein
MPFSINAFLDRFHHPDAPSYPAIALEANALKWDEKAVTPALFARHADLIKPTRGDGFSRSMAASFETRTSMCSAQDEVSNPHGEEPAMPARAKVQRSQTMWPRDTRS